MIVLEGLGAKPRSKDLTVTVQGGLRALCSEEAQSSCVCVEREEWEVAGWGAGMEDSGIYYLKPNQATLGNRCIHPARMQAQG